MNARVPIALLAVILVLGGYIYFVERDQLGTAARNERRKHLLQEYDEKRVRAVRFQDGVKITAEGEGFERRWRYTDGTLANEDEVDVYLSVWQHAVPLRTISLKGDGDLKQFGFSSDAPAVRFTMPSGDIAVTLGGEGSDGSFYVRVDDRDVARTIDAETAMAIKQTGNAFRTRPDGGYDLEDLTEETSVSTDTADAGP